ncbi:aminotransferase class I/II-fold pyridoxal phosphate-dependent enzyme [Kitasatospora sp. NBC_01287]|uniref:aminotransferase class I/II-fold pyridoxal phosphate-dependent enzyme n=1 Tax=Kitasatospora sp. NBC_01287 TaxID=2903573 RepID=UPI0022558DC3|nr:aminotransferase class I/II-fold pyridoxal phosphate-dependent enzyme [Kitasatospora sp. NBC_01287]MCX4744612.1 aminotransferase class I/II-fold pyridoxal phosphate-dependent enzyme [Kitasatospora sp. NBC_01287]
MNHKDPMDPAGPRNLTEYELQAQSSQLDLADGHANHSLHHGTRTALGRTFARSFEEPRHGQVKRVERRFLDALGHHTGQEYHPARAHIVYSASVATDIVAKHLALTGRRTGVIAPTFDNIPALVTMAGVEVVPVHERSLLPEPDLDRLDALGLAALVVVLPNNPTGTGMAPNAARRLLRWAGERDVLVVFDASFRLLDPSSCWDVLALAERCAADAAVIDDTGKALPLQDTKASVLTVTSGLAPAVSEIVSQYLLNVSCLDLRLLTTVLTPSQHCDEVLRARDIARSNRGTLRDALRAAGLAALLPAGAPDDGSTINVEWLHVGPAQQRILEHCRAAGLQILPGQPFFWSTGAGERPTGWVRVALLRDPADVRRGVAILLDAVRTHGESVAVSPAAGRRWTT